MVTTRTFLTVCLACVGMAVMAGDATPARADDSNRAAVIGKELVEGAHPSAENVRMSDCYLHDNSLYITVEWEGAVLGTQYKTRIRLGLTGRDGKLNYSYNERTYVPANTWGLERAIKDNLDDIHAIIRRNALR